ncbi:MAG: EamA family transporter [Patescibacteria group bacterium]|nr:EamA family transporter [Patescibacteria group bacterium]MDD4304471.1 EamA family transporter [Patescibacteria group bacterium]MDD4694831.1 EamA family transporter [Patescibacteria group bacterium]
MIYRGKILKIDKGIIIGAGAIMLAAFFWSLDGVFIRPKFYMLPAGLVVFLEHLFGLIILSPFLFINFYKLRHLKKSSWIAIFWVCIFGGLLGTLMITKAFFAAIDGKTTFSTVIILQKLQPIFALILARIFLKEKLSKKFYIWAFIGVIAAYFLAFGHVNIKDVNLFHSAAFFAFLAAFSFGSSTVFGKKIVNNLDSNTTAALRFGITTILALILIFITGDILQVLKVNSLQWQFLVLIVFTSGAGSMFLYYYGLKRITASTATICELFWPFSAILIDYFVNGNVLSFVQIVSSIVLLICFYFVVRENNTKRKVFTGNVIWGSGRGRKLGFPTANLDTKNLDIPHGVYLVNIYFKNGQYKGLLHFGYRATFHEDPSIEVFISSFDQDIYKENLKIEIISKIRDIMEFESGIELKKQIEKDLKYIV